MLSKASANPRSRDRIIICLTVTPLEDTHDKIGSPVSIDAAVAGGEQANTNPAPAAAAAAAPAAGRGGSNASKTSAAASRQAPAKPKATPGAGLAPGAPIYPIEGLSPYQNK